MNPVQVAVYREVSQMKKLFPQFRCRIKGGLPVWQGDLQPTETSPQYHISIQYELSGRCSVYVLDPIIKSNAPHRYSNHSLCLYYPKDKNSLEQGVARTIVPWTAEWLLYYEAWLVTGQWFGPEAPHLPDKIPDASV